MRRIAPSLVAGCALAIAACGTDGSARGSEVVIDTLAGGVVRVTSPVEGAWAPGEGWVLEEDLRIGTAAGDGPELFGRIAALAVDGEGRIHVLDNQAREVRVFAADGRHLRTIGREGGGPGEFANPVGLAIHPEEETLWVVDPGNGRFTVFGPEGDLVDTRPRPIGYFAWPFPGGFTAGGTLYDVVPAGLVALDGSAVPGDTVAIPPDETPRVSVASADGGMMMTLVPPFSPRLHWRFDPEGYLWTAVSDRLHFSRRPLGGEVDRIVRRDHHPVPVGRAEADSMRRLQQEMIERSGAGPDARVEGDLSAPNHKPAFQAFLVDDRGGLWVEPSRAEGDAERLFQVFDADGSYLGTVDVPDGFAVTQVLPVFRDGAVYAVITDDLDIPHVARYRIRGR